MCSPPAPHRSSSNRPSTCCGSWCTPTAWARGSRTSPRGAGTPSRNSAPTHFVPPPSPGLNPPGFAVPLRLRCEEGVLQLISTLTSFATALDITLAELHLEAYLPADEPTARILSDRRRRAGDEVSDTFPRELVIGT